MQEFLKAKQAEVAEVCRTHHVRRLAVFGSAARDDFDPSRSDVDLRVEFEEVPVEMYAKNYFLLREALVALFNRKVDLISARNIRNSYFRRELALTQVEMYAA